MRYSDIVKEKTQIYENRREENTYLTKLKGTNTKINNNSNSLRPRNESQNENNIEQVKLNNKKNSTELRDICGHSDIDGRLKKIEEITKIMAEKLLNKDQNQVMENIPPNMYNDLAKRMDKIEMQLSEEKDKNKNIAQKNSEQAIEIEQLKLKLREKQV